MVQAVDNLTRISGKILARRPHASLDGYDVATVTLERADLVAGKADLFSSLVGHDVEVTIRRDLLKTASPGARLRCRVKRTPDGAMCESHPIGTDFEIGEGP